MEVCVWGIPSMGQSLRYIDLSGNAQVGDSEGMGKGAEITDG